MKINCKREYDKSVEYRYLSCGDVFSWENPTKPEYFMKTYQYGTYGTEEGRMAVNLETGDMIFVHDDTVVNIVNYEVNILD